MKMRQRVDVKGVQFGTFRYALINTPFCSTQSGSPLIDIIRLYHATQLFMITHRALG
jgi:hypothetical protein